MTTLADAAAMGGGWRWCELALWQLLSSWAPSAAHPRAAVTWDAHAGHAAWRAGQWWDRLPVLAVVDREALVVPPPGWDGAVVAAAQLVDPLDRSAAAYRVLVPRLAASYAAAAPRLGAASDGPLRRTLAQAAADLGADWLAGESLLQSMVTDDAAAATAAATVSALEGLLVGPAGGHPAGEAAQ